MANNILVCCPPYKYEEIKSQLLEADSANVVRYCRGTAMNNWDEFDRFLHDGSEPSKGIESVYFDIVPDGQSVLKTDVEISLGLQQALLAEEPRRKLLTPTVTVAKVLESLAPLSSEPE